MPVSTALHSSASVHPTQSTLPRIFETIMIAKEQLSVAAVAYVLQIEPVDVVHALGIQSILFERALVVRISQRMVE